MSKIITLRKGLDINLQGKAQETLAEAPRSSEYAVSPLDFEGVTPKLLVKVGDKVKAGTPLFFNKYNERILFTSPVSGTVTAINRGEKRKVLNVTVAADAQPVYEEFARLEPAKASREEVVELLLKSGLWPMLVQRPYGIIADPNDVPKAVFISAFDSAPLAPDYNFVLQGEQKNLQTGIEVMRRLTSGAVHLSMRAGAEGMMPSLRNVEQHTFAGKHPVGNVGVQIHHIDPINKGEVAWTVNIQDLAIIGRLFNDLLKDLDIRGVGGMTMGADPLVSSTTVLSHELGRPLHGLLVRKESKGHGTNQFVEGLGNFQPGDPVAMLEDVVTTGGSLLKACDRVRDAGLNIVAVCAILDREEGGREKLKEAGYELHALFTRKELVELARQ